VRDGDTKQIPLLWLEDTHDEQPYEESPLVDRVSAILGALGIAVFVAALIILTVYGTPQPRETLYVAVGVTGD
jgi:hypothetical protein